MYARFRSKHTRVCTSTHCGSKTWRTCMRSVQRWHVHAPVHGSARQAFFGCRLGNPSTRCDLVRDRLGVPTPVGRYTTTVDRSSPVPTNQTTSLQTCRCSLSHADTKACTCVHRDGNTHMQPRARRPRTNGWRIHRLPPTAGMQLQLGTCVTARTCTTHRTVYDTVNHVVSAAWRRSYWHVG